MSKKETKKPKACQCNGTGQIFVMAGKGIFVPIPALAAVSSNSA